MVRTVVIVRVSVSVTVVYVVWVTVDSPVTIVVCRRVEDPVNIKVVSIASVDPVIVVSRIVPSDIVSIDVVVRVMSVS